MLFSFLKSRKKYFTKLNLPIEMVNRADPILGVQAAVSCGCQKDPQMSTWNLMRTAGARDVEIVCLGDGLTHIQIHCNFETNSTQGPIQ